MEITFQVVFWMKGSCIVKKGTTKILGILNLSITISSIYDLNLLP